jgi:hypothetical protein
VLGVGGGVAAERRGAAGVEFLVIRGIGHENRD